MNHRIITDITNFIFVSDEVEKVDAIFLPGGSYPEQPEYAVELYHQGYAKWLIPSGGISVKEDKWHGVRSKADKYNGNYRSECEFFTDVFLKNGVPTSAIIGEDQAGHTRDNAFLSRKAVDESGVDIKTALIVCKAFHARRCLMLYQMAFPNVDIKICPFPWYNVDRHYTSVGLLPNEVRKNSSASHAHPPEGIMSEGHGHNITKDNWYKSETGIDRVLGELARCGNQFVGDIKQYIL